MDWKLLSAVVLMTMALPASAYIGPGAGISVLGSLLGALTTLLLALFAILRWPLHWAWRRARRALAGEQVQAKAEPTDTDQINADQARNSTR